MFRRDVMLPDVRVIGIDVGRDYRVTVRSANQISRTNFQRWEIFDGLYAVAGLIELPVNYPT